MATPLPCRSWKTFCRILAARRGQSMRDILTAVAERRAARCVCGQRRRQILARRRADGVGSSGNRVRPDKQQWSSAGSFRHLPVIASADVGSAATGFCVPSALPHHGSTFALDRDFLRLRRQSGAMSSHRSPAVCRPQWPAPANTQRKFRCRCHGLDDRSCAEHRSSPTRSAALV